MFLWRSELLATLCDPPESSAGLQFLQVRLSHKGCPLSASVTRGQLWKTTGGSLEVGEEETDSNLVGSYCVDRGRTTRPLSCHLSH